MQVRAALVGAPGESPDHGVVAYHSAGRVVKGRQDGERFAFPEVDGRHQCLDLLGADHPAVDSEDAVELGPHSQAVDRGVGVAQVQAPHLVEQQVEVELCGQPFVELDAFVKERYPLGGQVVGADDGRGAGAGPAAQIAFVENGDVADTQLGQVVGGGQPVNAPADNRHVAAVPQGPLVPHPSLPKQLKHISRRGRKETAEDAEN